MQRQCWHLQVSQLHGYSSGWRNEAGTTVHEDHILGRLIQCLVFRLWVVFFIILPPLQHQWNMMLWLWPETLNELRRNSSDWQKTWGRNFPIALSVCDLSLPFTLSLLHLVSTAWHNFQVGDHVRLRVPKPSGMLKDGDIGLVVLWLHFDLSGKTQLKCNPHSDNVKATMCTCTWLLMYEYIYIHHIWMHVRNEICC